MLKISFNLNLFNFRLDIHRGSEEGIFLCRMGHSLTADEGKRTNSVQVKGRTFKMIMETVYFKK